MSGSATAAFEASSMRTARTNGHGRAAVRLDDHANPISSPASHAAVMRPSMRASQSLTSGHGALYG
jgi:hypothetical protein